MAEETWVVLSDIHSNLEAFRAVLADMRTICFNRMICLGDVAGYAARLRYRCGERENNSGWTAQDHR